LNRQRCEVQIQKSENSVSNWRSLVKNDGGQAGLQIGIRDPINRRE